MALSIAQAIGRIKTGVAEWLTPESIREACREVGHTWRERVLDPVVTIHLFVLQILSGNAACAHVPRLADIDCTGEAYGQARRRLPLAVFQRLLERLLGQLPVSSAEEGRWRGHRTFLIDGSSASMPDTPALQAKFGQPTTQAPGCGFPLLHLMAMFQAATGFLVAIVTAPGRTHDMAQASATHGALATNDLVVGDRGLASFAHLAMLHRQGIFGLFRTHQKQIVNFRPGRRHAKGPRRRKGETGRPTSRWVKRLGPRDQLVDYPKPTTAPKWMTADESTNLPETIRVRELRYTIAIPGQRTQTVTLTTTLLDPVAYPAAALAELYGRRWEIETNFAHLKTTLKMDMLHCKTVDGVQKELTMYALVYNLIRLVMLEAARRQQARVERISFVDAARWLAQAMAHPDDPPRIRLRLNPHRPHRIEPRALKRRSKPFPLLTRPRHELQKQLKTTSSAT